MKKLFSICLSLCFAIFVYAVPREAAQTDFDSFWKKFKTAVIAKDKTAVAALSDFPLGMPYGAGSVKNKAQFARRYNEIFNGEANAARCFQKFAPKKDDAKTYSVYCGFKGEPEDGENAPIKYAFELTKNGWRFSYLDNINE